MKSQVNSLLHVMQGLVKDVLAVYPELESLKLDLENLALQCMTRGLTVFTLDLPNLDSILLSGLESGRLRLSGPFTRRVSRRVRVPRLFSGLWLRVFNADSSLKPDADVTAVFFLRQLTVLGKRILVECSSDRIAATLENYHDIERRLRQPSLRWSDDRLNVEDGLDILCLSECRNHSVSELPSFLVEDQEDMEQFRSDRHLLRQIQQVADIVVSSMPFFSPLSISEELESECQGVGFKHGPGAVAEKLKNWEKSQFPYWPAKLENVFPYGLCGSTAGAPMVRPPNHEVASRLICVPKTAKGPRLIAAEPVAHQWCQQLILSWFDNQFKNLFRGSFIDLHDQQKSGDLVLDASRDRSLATVDLSDASDRLTCWTVERIFRKNPSLLCALHAARTRYIRDDISEHSGFLKTKKFASQGTATTFPVMSFVMLCIALGACIRGRPTRRKILELRNRVRVFGDDIIIPRHGYTRLSRAMDALQLKVNMAKSYVNGEFRESCGVDGFKGYDVTPVKPKTLVADSPASCQAVVDTSNNLFNKGLWYASDSCRSLIPARVQRALRIVGVMDAGYSGLTSFSGSHESHLTSRWNPRLHRNEVRVWSLSVQTQKRDREGYSALLDFFASKHNPERSRIVSEYTDTRKARDRFSWEPCSPHARVADTSS